MQFHVRMKCVVFKSVICECENEEQARSSTWEHAVHEIETDQVDWEVLSVEAE